MEQAVPRRTRSLLRRLPRPLDVERDEGVDVGIDALDLGEDGVEQLEGGELAPTQPLAQL